jgi:hypothetical protein
MPQKTNLNINPYYDDFNVEKNFYKVLFKPGFPVQARELTTLQSILQNQIESFGSHIFKEGSMVIPGSITYDNTYFSIKINPDHLGIDVSLYVNQLVGKTLIGQNSNNIAVVKNFSVPPQDGVEDITLYVNYLSSGDDFEIKQFEDGEILVTDDNITYGNTTIPSGNTVATLVSENATAIGSAVGLDNGVYFIRGTFVNAYKSQLVLDPYSDTTSYRVGLNILEEIVTPDDDSSLNDNARGFSNFSAPGADRFKITITLSKKDLDDFDDKNFVELIRIENGELKKLQDKSVYSIIKDYLAERTYDESGDYAISRFDLDVLNSLNDGISNEGIYLSNERTSQGNVPSDDLMCVKVSSGKAYVRGFDVSFPGSTIIDVEKPRDAKNIPSSLVPFEMGNLLRINNVSGSPFIGIGTGSNIVEFYNQRKNSTSSGTGNLIGKGRVYSFNLTDASYSDATTEWDLYLYDVQTYTILFLNSSVDSSICPPSSFVRGLSSGATGYVVDTTISSSISLSQVSGTFIEGEQILINESLLNSRSVNSVRVFTTEDIKSVYQDSTTINSELKVDFVGDTVLYRKIPRGFSISDTLSINSAGIATCAGKSFVGIKTDTIIRYQRQNLPVETFNRVLSVAADGNSITLGTVPNVAGICSGALPTTTETVTFSLGIPEIRNQDKSSIYTELNTRNVSSIDFSNANLLIYTQLRELSTNSGGTLVVNISDLGLTDVFFESFDAERYSIFYSNGTIEDLTSDQVIIASNGTQLTIGGLLPNQSSSVTLNLTVRKSLVTNKSKIFVRSEKLIVDKTISDQSTEITGLSSSQYYGLRVEDPEISLNVPDVVNVRAVYESLTTSAPVLDRLTFVTGLNLDVNSIIGEKIVGNNGAIAQLVTRVSSTEIEFVYLNSKKFQVGETVTFEESQITTNIQLITIGSYLNTTSKYSLDKGQKNQYYDYSKIVRSRDSSSPSRQILIVFDYYDIPLNDFGDVVTVNSYDAERFGQDIPILEGGLRSSDTLDFRPRVAKFTSTNRSPFDFDSKQFLPGIFDYVIAPNESSLIGYSYYLPRIDKLVLNKTGEFSIIKGISADDPKTPLNVEESMDVATIQLPAYLYDPKEAKITLQDNRRYTMRDIGKLEDRLENLEIVSSLSLLELDTKTLQIQDADGLTRFKTGFFVDDFKSTDLFDDTNSDLKCDVNVEKKEMLAPVDFWSLKFELALRPDINTETADFSENLPLLDSNVRKTGDLITLNYREKIWLEQPLATNVENVNPFNVVEYAGGIILNPSSDNWTRNIYIENRRTVFARSQTTTVTTTRVRTGPWWWWWWRRPAVRETTTTTTVSGSPIGEYDYVESVKVTTEPDPYMRSRNVEFRAGALKPQTRHYPYFDEISGIDIIPKLIEITMVSGTFEVGEDIFGFVGEDQIFSARLARPDHKAGSFRNPTSRYNLNPYDRNSSLPTSYSASSSVLNIDTFSLAEESLTKYGGHIEVGMKIVGSSGGAVARVRQIRLITDTFGDLIGSFFLRDPNDDPAPLIRVKTGNKIFKLTAEPPGSQSLPGSTTFASQGQVTYSASGIIQTQVTNIVQVRNPPPPPPPPPRRRGGKDPLAQSFTVDETGAFLTSVDVYFASKDPKEKLYVELRTMELGTPTNQLVQDYSRIVLEPDDIKTSDDASVATRIRFPSPVYLQPQTEYALVFLAPTTDAYEMWVGTMGQKTVNTQNLPNPESVVMTKQYTGGSLFKSQNGTIWTASQFQDMKFRLYKAEFTSTSGEVVFYNPPLRIEEGTLQPLRENAINTLPRKLRVGITTTTSMNSILTVGRKISEGSSITGPTGPIGFIENAGGPINSISISNAGIGYSQGTYTNIPFYPITGSGTGASGTITINSSGNVSTVSVTLNGSGYANGDVLGITTSNLIKGQGARISVTSINGIDTLYLSNVQGEQFTPNQSIIYFQGNDPISLASTTVRGTSSVIDPIFAGNVFEVSQFNHGMHAANNLVQIKNISPDTTPVTLSAPLNIGDTSISIASTIGFNNFEGISTSRGFIKVEDEIIFYDGISVGNVLGISTRGVDGTFITNHDSGSIAHKYELNGVSLRKINTTHNMASIQNSGLQRLKDFDRYYLSFERDPERSFGSSQLSFTDEKFAGGVLGSRNAAAASQNQQFTNITPQFNIITPGSTSTVSSQIRTVSGTSAGGNEVSFVDQGFEPVELNKANFFTTPRMICSEINEKARLSALPKNKSLTVKVRMSSGDPNLSPVLDLQTAYMVIGRNKVNNPISNYAFDGRVNLVEGDPHSAVYLSTKIDIQQPATSLKVLIGAYRPASADFRVLYRIFKPNSSEIDPSFTLFPGYDNLRDTNGDGFGDVIINPTLNSGRSDSFIRSSKNEEFLEYQFTADSLDQFSAFQIKIVMSSTNESFAPKFKDLRVIALA